MSINMVIYGEPCSKANSRRLVKSKAGRPLFIKSQEGARLCQVIWAAVPKDVTRFMEDDVAVHDQNLLRQSPP